MGACEFFTYEEGADMGKAFQSAHDQAAWEHGHGGYTGTIAEKHGAQRIADAPRFEDKKAAYAWAQDDLDVRDNDKWEDAWAVPVYEAGGGDTVVGWLFYGYASS